MLKRFFHEEEGQTLIEYGLIVALISIVAIAILTIVGRKGRDVYVSISERMATTSD
jgi:pilus assembly protein Flp/PilA